jgi:hypothetical protein
VPNLIGGTRSWWLSHCVHVYYFHIVLHPSQAGKTQSQSLVGFFYEVNHHKNRIEGVFYSISIGTPPNYHPQNPMGNELLDSGNKSWTPVRTIAAERRPQGIP